MCVVRAGINNTFLRFLLLYRFPALFHGSDFPVLLDFFEGGDCKVYIVKIFFYKFFPISLLFCFKPVF